MINLLNTLKRKRNEEAFTLLELIIVVVILGILAAIAIPIFTKQQESASGATLKTDLRNAATVMTTEKATHGKFPKYIPSFNTVSDNNQIILDTENSGNDGFCLVGQNTATKEILYYSSSKGKVTSNADDCASTLDNGSGGKYMSFQAENAATLTDKKAVIIKNPNQSSSTAFKNEIAAYGYGQVDVIVGSDSLDYSAVSKYDFIFINYAWWTAPGYWWIDTALNEGKVILADGNDTNSSRFYIKSGERMSTPGGYNPTFNGGLTPSYPYLFSAEAWGGNDSWNCVKEVDAVTIATVNVEGKTCYTMWGKNVGPGKLVYMSYVKGNDKVFISALNWLTS